MSLYNNRVKEQDNQNSINEMKQSGILADVPTTNLYAGRRYFDTTSGRPLWYDAVAEAWVLATGVEV